MPGNEVPTYNLKAVLKQTGLKADTLRAWERRYGLPKPERTPGRHRLYSRRDIETIKWLQARQYDGISISNAVDLWQNLVDEGNDPLLMTEFSATHASLAPVPASGGRGLGELRALWVSSCNAFDETTSARILSEAFALYAVEDVCLQLIFDGLRRIGDGWYEGQIAVEQEHFASEIARRQLEALISAAPSPTRSETLLVGAAPGEQYDLVLLMITLLLRRRGWDVVYLGANVPLESYETILDPARFDLALLSAQQLFAAANLREVALLAQKVGLPLVYGGRIFRKIPELQNQIPGSYLGEQLEAIPGLVAQWLASSFPRPSLSILTDRYQDAQKDFQEQSPYIELAVRQSMSGQMPPGSLETANFNFTRDIQAALFLGDLNHAGQELIWINGLLRNRGLPSEILASYLDAYFQAADDLLGDGDRLVVDWLQQFKAID
jgi:DNA-binding transcriptional MerR regulator